MILVMGPINMTPGKDIAILRITFSKYIMNLTMSINLLFLFVFLIDIPFIFAKSLNLFSFKKLYLKSGSCLNLSNPRAKRLLIYSFYFTVKCFLVLRVYSSLQR